LVISNLFSDNNQSRAGRGGSGNLNSGISGVSA
jgi:hypothetical protein